MKELLKKLTQITAPSGNEELIRDFITNEIKDYTDEITTDALGNLIAHKSGGGSRVMFAAHADEIGVIVTFIEENGLLRISSLGGVSPYSALSCRVKFVNGVLGSVAFEKKDGNTLKNLSVKDLFVDIGAASREEAEEKIAVGTAGGFIGDFYTDGKTAVSKALDNRAGCAALIHAIKSVKTHKNDLYFVFTASEELGLRGARVAANALSPDYAIALDVTRAGDIPDIYKSPVKLGGGVCIKIKDSSFIVHPEIKKFMTDMCEKHNIAYQLAAPDGGATDTGAIHLSGGGVPSGCISVPARYIHTTSEMINLDDLNCAAHLSAAMIEKGF